MYVYVYVYVHICVYQRDGAHPRSTLGIFAHTHMDMSMYVYVCFYVHICVYQRDGAHPRSARETFSTISEMASAAV